MSDKDEATKSEARVPTSTGNWVGVASDYVTLSEPPIGYGPIEVSRAIIQIAVSPSNTETVVALCNDGTVWRSDLPHEKWIKMREIPQGEEE